MQEGTARAARAPRRWLRYTLYGLAMAVLVVGATVAYLFATFEPLDHRQRIVDFVKERTGRTLDIRGEVELSFWPDLGIRLGALTLSERDSAEPFAGIESARLRLELEPLLSRELVASEIVLNGASVRIVRFEDGRLNIDDLLQGEGEPPRFDIARVVVESSTFTYHDLGSGAQYTLEDIALETGRLANAVPTSIVYAARARDGRDRFDLRTTLKGGLTFDLESKRYAFERMRVGASGRVPGIEDLAFEAAASGSFDRATGVLDLTAPAAKASGTYAGDALTLALEAARLEVQAGHAAAKALRLRAGARGSAGTTSLDLAADAMQWAHGRLASDAIAADLALERGGHKVQAKIASQLDARIEERTLELSAMEADFSAQGGRLPRKGLAGKVRGDARIDLAKEGVDLTLAGRIDESDAKIRLSAAGFASPVYTFAVTLNRLDLDRYLAAGRGKPPPRAPAAAGVALFAPLAKLPAKGTLVIGTLKVAQTQSRNVRLVLE